MEERIQLLESKIRDRYQLRELSLNISGEQFELLTVSSIDDLLEELLARGDEDEAVKDERIPYWADIWHSSIGLAAHILESPFVRPGIKVLEIGCGLALSGIAAGRKGAGVILSDYLPEALEMAELLWLKNNEQDVQTQIIDWRYPPSDIKVDLLLAADVAYERRNFDPLMNAFQHLLKPGGKIWLSEPGRPIAKRFLDDFERKGFWVEKSFRKVDFRGVVNKIGIYELRAL